MKKAVILSGKRTAIGTFLGSFQKTPATDLGGAVVKAALDASKATPAAVSELIMGNVLSAGLGQNPARQMALRGGLDVKTPCLNVNKVCASGMKALTLGATNIIAGLSEVVVAGGAECMSMSPHLLYMRGGMKMGDSRAVDSLTHDGLVDAFQHVPMGTCAEKTATELKLTREMQDEYAVSSYERALQAAKTGLFEWEVVPVEVKGQFVTLDEEPRRFERNQMSTLRPVFPPFGASAGKGKGAGKGEDGSTGTITAGNASKINDGACAFVLAAEEFARRTDLRPLAEIVSFADAETSSVDFNTCPALAARRALQLARLKADDIDLWEINEAFSVTALANIKLLGLSPARVNVHGGAVALGHPIGMSGARIVLSLLNALRVKDGRYGLATICNGGGGATAIIIKRAS